MLPTRIKGVRERRRGGRKGKKVQPPGRKKGTLCNHRKASNCPWIMRGRREIKSHVGS